MRVCFLNMPIEFYSPTCGGAVSTIIAGVGGEMLKLGHEVTVLSIANEEPVHSVGNVVRINSAVTNPPGVLARKWHGALGRWYRWEFPQYEMYRRSFSRALRQMSHEPEAVITFNDLTSAYYLRSVLPKARLLTWLQNEWTSRFRFSGEALKSLDCILTCSEYIREWTMRRYGLAEERVRTARSGASLDEFCPRADFIAPVKPVRVLFVGRIDPNKGPDIAADAVASLRKEGLAVTLTVAGGLWFYGGGDPDQSPYFRELKTKMAAVEATYLGHVPRGDLPALYREHDVVCVLSRSNEPFGLVTLEAMASGCAVIASRRGGLPEACGGAATLVDPDDLGAVVGAIRRLVMCRDELARAKQASVARAAKASWGSVAQELEAVLTSCA